VIPASFRPFRFGGGLSRYVLVTMRVVMAGGDASGIP